MNKKGGFTLIELLAVIVILAIIALIATPIVLNIIDDTKKQAGLRSADFYLDAVELSIAQATLKGQNINDGTYNILENGNICLVDLVNGSCPTDKILTVEVKGEVPSGTITILNGQISGVEIVLNDKTIIKDDKGELAYALMLPFCELKEYATNIIGSKYSCDFGGGERNFYILELGIDPVSNTTLESDEVALILEGNYDTTTQSWCASGVDNSCNADGLAPKLDEIASVWTKLERSQILLPSVEQVATVDGKVYTAYPQLEKTWLYQWEGNADYSLGENVPYGYWTSSPYADDSLGAWYVSYGGRVYGRDVDYADVLGVRPVINLKI